MSAPNEDILLIERLRGGNDAAFRELIQAFQNKVYNTCMGFVGNEEDAADIAQEVFIQVYERIPQFRGDAKLGTWIYRIAVSRCLDFLRGKKRKKRFGFMIRIFEKEGKAVLNSHSDFRHPGVAMEDKEKVEFLFRGIDNLPDNQRTAVTLFYLEQLSYKEVAEVMEVSESAVDSLLSRARNNLKKRLGGN